MRELTEPAIHIPAFSDQCSNCHQDTSDPIYLRHYKRFVIDKPYCESCIEEVTKSRYQCRNVSEMTAYLVQTDSTRYNEMADKLTPYKPVKHI